MIIYDIKWLDEDSKEAILRVEDNNKCLICFSQPCLHKIGDHLEEPLECLDSYDIITTDLLDNNIIKLNDEFSYKLKGEIVDIKKGIVKVETFLLHIDEDMIPKDMVNNQIIQFTVSRIDVW